LRVKDIGLDYSGSFENVKNIAQSNYAENKPWKLNVGFFPRKKSDGKTPKKQAV